MPIPLNSKIIISSDVLTQEVNNETVLLDMQSEDYFGLDAVGTRFWQLLQAHNELQKIFDIMRQEYDVEEQQLELDLNDLLSKLLDKDLVSLE
ncbi:PqqD family protein [Methyloprofundus sp.]|uniref:PqqD family protein n=1 Tax=Methyloprofundus sp. TaxID=2020875 RepID=UPI003D0DC453